MNTIKLEVGKRYRAYDGDIKRVIFSEISPDWGLISLTQDEESKNLFIWYRENGKYVEQLCSSLYGSSPLIEELGEKRDITLWLSIYDKGEVFPHPTYELAKKSSIRGEKKFAIVKVRLTVEEGENL